MLVIQMSVDLAQCRRLRPGSGLGHCRAGTPELRFDPETAIGAAALGCESAAGRPVSRCAGFFSQVDAAPGISRAAQSVPWGFLGFGWKGWKEGEDTSDLQLVPLNLYGQRALDRFD